MEFPLGLKRAAAMIILRADDQYLLLKRAKAPNQGMYVPVGGKLDPHEDPYSAALREAYEETGICVEELRYAGVLVESSPVKYNWWCNIYIADIPWQAAPSCDEGELHWLNLEQIKTIPTPPTDWHIYQYVIRGQAFALNAIYNEHLELISMKEEIENKQLVGR